MKKLLHKAKNLSWTILDQGMVSGVNFAVGILIARFLGVKEFGIFSLLLMAILFVQSIQKALIITPMMSVGPKIEEREKKSLLSSSDNTTACILFYIKPIAIFRYDFERSFFLNGK